MKITEHRTFKIEFEEEGTKGFELKSKQDWIRSRFVTAELNTGRSFRTLALTISEHFCPKHKNRVMNDWSVRDIGYYTYELGPDDSPLIYSFVRGDLQWESAILALHTFIHDKELDPAKDPDPKSWLVKYFPRTYNEIIGRKLQDAARRLVNK